MIGVVRTTKYFRLHESPQPYLYLPYSQNYVSRMVLHVETKGPPSGSTRAVLDQVRSLDRGMPVSEVRPLKDGFVKGATFGARIGAQLLGAAGLCGLMLSVAGVYGVVSSSVARRRREIAIRMALGARRPAVVVLIVGHGVKLVGVGAASACPRRWQRAGFWRISGRQQRLWTAFGRSRLDSRCARGDCSKPRGVSHPSPPGVARRSGDSTSRDLKYSLRSNQLRTSAQPQNEDWADTLWSSRRGPSLGQERGVKYGRSNRYLAANA